MGSGASQRRSTTRVSIPWVTLTLAGKGLGVAPVTEMMIGLNSSVPIIRIALVQEIVLIRPAGADARPTIRAVAEIVQDGISDRS